MQHQRVLISSKLRTKLVKVWLKMALLCRCGVQSIRQGETMQRQIDIPHGQFQCLYSKPGELPSDESGLAYWHLNVLYSHDTGLYKSGNVYTDEYQVNVYAQTCLLDVAPHYYSLKSSFTITRYDGWRV